MKMTMASLLLVSLGACSSPSTPPPGVGADPARGGQRSGVWLRAETERKGTPMQWELRENLATAQRAALPNLLVVSSYYASNNPAALPDAGQLKAFVAYEDRLQAALKGKAELVAVLSWNHQHDWYYYTGSNEVLQLARALTPPSDDAALSISIEADADGEFYTKLRSKIQPQ